MEDHSTAPHDLPTARKTTRRREETRDRLIAAAFDVFAEVGVRGASVELICDRAGYTRGAFYSNFSRKEELLSAIADAEHSAAIRRLDRAIQAAIDERALHTTEDAIGMILRGFIELHHPTRKWLMFWREFELEALRDPQIAEAFTRYQDATLGKLAEMVETTARNIGRGFIVPPLDLVKACSGIFEASLQESFSTSPEPNVAEGLVARIAPTLILHMSEETVPDDTGPGKEPTN